MNACLPAAAAALIALAHFAPAQAQDSGGQAAPTAATSDGGSVTERVINDPRPDTFRPYGMPIPPAVRNDKTVQFGRALRIPVGSGGPIAGRIGVTLPIGKPVKAGERLVVAFWARATRTDGGLPGKIAPAMVEIAAAPHRRLFEQPVDIGPEWTMHRFSGTVDGDYAANTLNVAMHLGAVKQVIELGPVFVLRYPKK